MRKIIYAFSVSLDGYIEDPNGDLGWSSIDDELHQHFNDLDASLDVHFYGRGLYEIMSAYWPTADEDLEASKIEIEYARIWKDMKKIVFSRTLKQVGWNSELVREDVAGVVERLKAQHGKDMSVGGAGIASTFMLLDLIDEYRLYIHPVILGGGKPMFSGLTDPIKLSLIESYTFKSGVVMLRYQRNRD